ncbi:hypothetical protein D3C76_1152280 [compost metagenome]
MICPARWRCISGNVAAIPCSTPRIFTSIIRSHSSTLSASSLERGITPALLTSTSTRSKQVTAKSMKSWTSFLSVTSRARNSALPPQALISPAIFSSRSVRRAPSTTFAPWLASSRAAASPIPLLAPVIAMTLSLMFNMIGFLFCSPRKRVWKQG